MTTWDLSERHRLPELMDSPDLEPARHHRALEALRRANRVSGVAPQLLAEMAALQPGPEPLRVLDVACGGGDVAIGLDALARRRGIPLEVRGCDVSPVALAHAREQAERAGSPVEFFPWDMTREPVPAGFDVVTCTLFLHHLDPGEVVDLLRSMGAAARRLVVVQDLVRSRMGMLLVRLAGRLLTRSDVFRIDGALSVRAAFTPDEARELARRAGLDGARVRRCRPQRFLLTWSPS